MQAFASAVHLHAQGVFSWPEWAACLATKSSTEQLGDADSGDPHYHHWLASSPLARLAGTFCRWQRADD